MNKIKENLTPKIDRNYLDRLFDLEGTRTLIAGGYGAIGEAISRGFA